MAVPLHSELIRQGMSQWNQWRTENPDVRPDLVWADLSEADLSEANLSGANISEADLSGAHLRRAYLREAHLSDAYLRGADLRGADLRGADLSRADLSQAHLSATILGDSNLTEAKGLDTCVHHGPSTLDHRTFARSGQLPISFLRGCGLPDTLIEYLPSLLNRPIEFYSCFISYHHTDKAFVRLLHDTLQG